MKYYFKTINSCRNEWSKLSNTCKVFLYLRITQGEKIDHKLLIYTDITPEMRE